jgi:hypothetical protein
MEMGKNHKTNIIEVIKSLIYHGRHFNPKRDEIVIQKSYDRILDIFGEIILEGEDETR